MLARVPRDAGVVAGFEFLPRLANRPNVHSIHHVLRGRYTYSEKPYPLPTGVRAVLADLGASALLSAVRLDTADRLDSLIAAGHLHPRDAADDLVLWLADGPDAGPALDLVAPAPTAAPARAVLYDDALERLDARLADSTVAAGGALRFRVDWRRVAPVQQLHLTEFVVMNADGRMALQRWRYLGYVAWPPHRWPAGVAQRESYALTLPRELPPGRYQLGVRPWWRGGGQQGVSRTLDPEASAGLGFTTVGAFEVTAPVTR